MKKIHKKGFTLLETMIVVVIISIIASIAYPSYMAHLVKTRRTEGQIALMALSQKMERYYAENNTFIGATLNNIGADGTSGDNADAAYYELSIDDSTVSHFEVSAAPLDSQADNDTDCGILAMNSLGQKGRKEAGVFIVDMTCW